LPASVSGSRAATNNKPRTKLQHKETDIFFKVEGEFREIKKHQTEILSRFGGGVILGLVNACERSE